MNGPVFVSTVNALEEKVAGLIASAEARLDDSAHALDPSEALAGATIALGEIALATFLRGGR